MARSFYRGYESGDAPGMNQDTTLLSAVQQGDERALAQLYDRYSGLVYSISLRVLRDTAAAEDVLQEVFMQIWRRPEVLLKGRTSLAGWLAIVARNRSIDVLRRQKSTFPVEETAIAARINLAEDSERNWMADKARSVILTLAPEQRKALEMAFYDGLTHTEIAALTGEPLGTIKSRIRAGLLTLRKAMQA